jgi:hypothetical protein
MTTFIRTALLSALVFSLGCGFATAIDAPTGSHGVNSASAAVSRQALMVKCRDPIECSKGRA